MNKSQQYISKTYKRRIEGGSLLTARMQANKWLRKQYPKWFKTLDILIILGMLMNFGALFITGVLVMKVAPDTELKEANPTQCNWNGWSCHDNARQIFFSTVGLWLSWGILLAWYIINRFTVYNIPGMWMMTVAVILLVTILGADFTNDLGLYLGKILYASIVV